MLVSICQLTFMIHILLIQFCFNYWCKSFNYWQEKRQAEKKTWEDNIREWMGLIVALNMVDAIEEWRKIIKMTSMAH